MELELVFAIGVLLNRLLLVLACVLCIWFGYRLFSRIAPSSTAEISYRDVLRLNLFHIGPGVFFCLFGTGLLAYSLYKPPVLARHDNLATTTDVSPSTSPASDLKAQNQQTQTPPVAPAATSHDSAKATTIAGAARTHLPQDPVVKVQAIQQVAFLNRVLLDSRQDCFPETVRRDIGRQTREIKLSLLRNAWDSEWGEYEDFEMWARGTTSTEPNPAAAKLFASQ